MLLQLDRINRSALGYIKSVSAIIDELCQPLLNQQINTFIYSKSFDDGRYMYLSNNEAWAQHFIQLDHAKMQTTKYPVNETSSYNYIIWPNTPSDPILKMLYEFNIWNGLTVLKRGSDYVETWAFASSTENNLLASFFSENIDIIHGFIAFFNRKAESIIATNDNAKLSVNKGFISKNFSFHSQGSAQQLLRFIKKTNINKFPIITPQGEFFLSRRELQCLHQLSLGRTAKETGQLLDLSNRSIELYLRNIKRKTYINNRTDLVDVYKKNCLHVFQ